MSETNHQPSTAPERCAEATCSVLKRTFCDMPIAECPHCGKQWQWDDYYDVSETSERDCPNCGKTCFVETVEHRIEVTLTTRSPNDQAERRRP